MPRSQILLIAMIVAIFSIGFINPYLLFILFLPGILIIIDIIWSCINASYDDIDSMIFGLIYSIRFKRTYTKYGRFYVILGKDDYLYLFQDRLFYLKYIGVKNFVNIQESKDWIKKEVDIIYQFKMEKDLKRNELKSWNGYVDLQTERDNKLNKLV